MKLLEPFMQTQATGLFVLSTLPPVLYWLARVFREAAARRVPGVAWWAVPGWILLLFAGFLAQPTFFALGAAALLLAEFWPWAYKAASTRPPAVWATFGLVLGAALLFTLLQQGGSPAYLALGAALWALLAGLAGLTAALGWRAEAARPAQASSWARLARVNVPERPDLSLTLTARGAELQNISSEVLHLSGWSPAKINAWLPFNGAAGQRVNLLETGQSTFLSLEEAAGGLRVWYVRGDEHEVPLLFRADWHPARSGRVLN